MKFYDFYEFCETGNIKECPDCLLKYYPVELEIIQRWKMEYPKATLQKIGYDIKQGKSKILPKKIYALRKIKKLDPFKVNFKINFCRKI